MGMVALGSRVGVKQFSQEDLDMLVSIASVAALRVRNVALAEEAAARKVLERELALAHDMQMSMLPRRMPSRASIDLAARLTPARSVGGDLYDFVEDGDNLWFIVADVSGKGVAAALVTAVVKTLFRAMAPGETDIARVLSRMNDELCRDNDQMMFVTAMVGCVNLNTGQLSLGDVGHNPAFLIGADGRLTPASVPKSIAFGVLPDAPFEAGSLDLARHRMLVLYTDGVTDARSVKGDMFGQERLEAALRESGTREAASGVLDHLYSRIESFAAGAPPEDDITVLVLRYDASRTPR
jgi:sigma-B regulation protein RsbU (phosphoserine phosphatase)